MANLILIFSCFLDITFKLGIIRSQNRNSNEREKHIRFAGLDAFDLPDLNEAVFARRKHFLMFFKDACFHYN